MCCLLSDVIKFLNPLSNVSGQYTGWLCLALCLSTPCLSSERLLNDIETLRQASGIPALALIVVDVDKVLFQSVNGYADQNKKIRADRDTIFRLGSITKTFSAMAIMQEVERGSLKLNDRLIDYGLNRFYHNPLHEEYPIKLVNLLEHTSGFQDLSRYEFNHSDANQLPLIDALNIGRNYRYVRWPAGLHASYSNAGAGIAAYLLEKKSKQKFEEYLNDKIFTVLGMENTGFLKRETLNADLAIGYGKDGVSEIPYWHVIQRPFGGLNSNLSDMAKFLRMLLNDGRLEGARVLNKQSIRRLERTQTTLASTVGLAYGEGMGIHSFDVDGHSLFGHGGDADGFLAHYAYSRESGLGYFVAINAFKSSDLYEIRKRLNRYLIEGLKTIKARKSVLLKQAWQEKVVGSYVSATQRFGLNVKRDRLEIIERGGQLLIAIDGGARKKIVPTTPHLFRYSQEMRASIAVVEYKGKIYLQSSSGNYQKIDNTASSPRLQE